MEAYLFDLEMAWHLTIGRAGGRKGCPGREKIVGKGENYSLEKAGNSVCYRKRKVQGEDVQLEPSTGTYPRRSAVQWR